MKDAVKFLKYSGIVFVLSISMIGLTFLRIVAYPKDLFVNSNHYQTVIQRKYDNLVNTKEPKIIVIGGSSAGFGINEEMLRKATGYEVVNLGLHAGLGGLFNTEIAKANINKGDIVLLGYEYGWGGPIYFDKLGIELVMSGIDSRIDIYKSIPLSHFNEVLGYLFTFAGKKTNVLRSSGTYSAESFNEKGEMILERKEYTIKDYKNNADALGKVVEGNLAISQESKEYLQAFKKYVENKGANIYFVAPPLLEEAYQGDKGCLDEFVLNAVEQTGIPYISDPREYLFPSDLIFDQTYHCNSKGEVYRTELLIKDLKKVL